MGKLRRFFLSFPFLTLAVFISGMSVLGFTGVKAHSSPANFQKLSASYGKLPLYFEENRGQTDARARFLSRGSGYSLFLADREAVLVLKQKNSDQKSSVVRMGLLGSNPKPLFVAEGKLPGTSNYFIGQDPSRWKTHIALHSKIRMKEVYPGIDMVYYGNQRQLEYDFVVKPGADPKSIRLSFKGIQHSQIDSLGNLVLSLSMDDGKDRNVVFKTPVLYQEKEGQRKTIQGRYVRLENNGVGFEVSDYDPSRTLVIDPVLNYSTYLGGSGSESGAGSAIAADAAGNAYVTGSTSGSFPAKAGGYQTSFGGGSNDIFITKLDPTGTSLVYSTYLGGTGSQEYGRGIAVDGNGNAYIAGQTDGNFPTTSGAYQTTYGGGTYDAIMAKLSPDGSTLLYSTYFGGTGGELAQDVAVDANGDVYIIGDSTGTTPTTSGALQTVYGGVTSSSNAIVAKFHLAGAGNADLIYSTYIGSTGTSQGQRIKVNSNGNAYIMGNATANLQTTAGAYQTIYGGGGDGFIAELNPTGTGFVFCTYFGGSNAENAGNRGGMALDANGNIYVMNDSHGGTPMTGGAFQTTFNGGTVDCYVAKFNPSGSTLIYSTYLGGNGQDTGGGIAVDTNGNAYVSGHSGSTNFPITGGAIQPVSGSPGNWDVFLVELNPTGTGLLYSTWIGGNTYDYSWDLAADGNGGIYITGMTGGNFPTTAGAYQTVYGGPIGGGDSFIVKFGFPLVPTDTPTGTLTLTSTPFATTSPVNTSTNTPTSTASLTITITPTTVNTFLATLTASPVNTATNTPTRTPTSTPTDTPIPTFVPSTSPTFTFSPTYTITPTTVNTFLATLTASPVNTATNTPTRTPTNTPTNSPALTSTPTATFTMTATSTSTATDTWTSTSTDTSTAIPTSTATNTITLTPTAVLAVPTATHTPGEKEKPICYPNPCKEGSCHIRSGGHDPSDHVRVCFYTLSGRKICEKSCTADQEGQADIDWDVKDKDGSNVCNGLYYAVFINEKKFSRDTCKVLIMR